jgi:hypothetical protein
VAWGARVRVKGDVISLMVRAELADYCIVFGNLILWGGRNSSSKLCDGSLGGERESVFVTFSILTERRPSPLTGPPFIAPSTLTKRRKKGGWLQLFFTLFNFFFLSLEGKYEKTVLWL